jgi:hypothetical protein
LQWAISRLNEWRMAVFRFAGHLILLSALPLSLASGQSGSASQATPKSAEIQVYASADEASEQIGVLLAGENVTPIAENQGGSGVKWYLFKTKGGVIGWIKQNDNDNAKKVDAFFKSLPQNTAATPVTIPNVSSTVAPSGAIIIPVISAGRSTIVSVTFNQTITGNLTLDTGATNTVISRRLAGLLSLRTVGNAAVQTVGGVIPVAIARLRSLRVGEAEVTDIPVVVHDFSRDPRVEGLLGMDFLGRYRIGLDVQKQVLVLSPK